MRLRGELLGVNDWITKITKTAKITKTTKTTKTAKKSGSDKTETCHRARRGIREKNNNGMNPKGKMTFEMRNNRPGPAVFHLVLRSSNFEL